MPEFVVSLNSPNLTTGRAEGSSVGAPGEALVESRAMMELSLRLRLLAIAIGATGRSVLMIRERADIGFLLLGFCGEGVVGGNRGRTGRGRSSFFDGMRLK